MSSIFERQAPSSGAPPGGAPGGPPGMPMPTVAQIMLPPGFTLPQYLALQGHIVEIAICVAVAFGVICWDYAVLLPDEIRLYRTNNKSLWKTPATWAFLVLRYAAFVAALPSLFFTSIQNQYCEATVRLSSAGAVLVVASSGIIFCNRVVAIYSNNKFVIAFLAVLWAGMVGCWIAVAVQYHAITGPPTPFGSNCQMVPIVSWAPLSYVSSVVFDVIVLLLTVVKLRSKGSSAFGQSEIAKQISNDNMSYFILTTVTNITVLSIQALGDDYALIKPTAVPFSTVITVAMAQRVYLNLKLFHQRKERAAAGLPVTQVETSGSIPVKSLHRKTPSGAEGFKSFAPSWETDRKDFPHSSAVPPMPVVYINREVHNSHPNGIGYSPSGVRRDF